MPHFSPLTTVQPPVFPMGSSDATSARRATFSSEAVQWQCDWPPLLPHEATEKRSVGCSLAHYLGPMPDNSCGVKVKEKLVLTETQKANFYSTPEEKADKKTKKKKKNGCCSLAVPSLFPSSSRRS